MSPGGKATALNAVPCRPDWLLSDWPRGLLVPFVIESHCIRLAKPIEERLQRGEDGCGDADHRSDGDRDGASCPIGPVRHCQPRGESTNQLAEFSEELCRRRLEDLEGDLEIAGHQLAGTRVTPRRVTNGTMLRGYAEMADGAG